MRKMKIAPLFALSILAFCFMVSPYQASASPASPYTIEIADETVPLAGGLNVLTTASPGTELYEGGGAAIDASNRADGYITAKYSGSNNKIKLQISKKGGTTYTYNLNTAEKYEVFPLTAGDGSYQISIYKNVTGTQYALALGQSIDVKLRNANLPFLYPNQYVNFRSDSKAILKGDDLATTATNDLGIVTNVYDYVVGNIKYDTQKAQTVQSGYLPDIDETLATNKGICFDYAAIMAAMLRSQQIPTRLEVGYVSGGIYHSWISTYIKDIGWINGIIQFDGKTWKLMDPTLAAGGAGPDFIGDGTNYQTMYIY